VDLAVTALTNVFETVLGDQLNDPNRSWLFLDIGAQKTIMIIYRQKTVAFSKEMNIGGVMITEEIQRQMGVNYFEAEDLKITGDENGNLPEEILEIVDDTLEAFFTEIKKTVDFYVSSTSDEMLKNCVLTGGGALIPGLVQGLEALLNIEISVLNPFDVIDYDKKKFDDTEIQNIAFRGCVSIGLAMREMP
jgi:type IV pilus assembly protein PilM